MNQKDTLVWSIVPAVFAFGFYFAFAPPVSGDKDGSEFTLTLVFNGVAHPTGYPLYSIFGHLFVSLFHIIGVSFQKAANGWSGLGGAVAVFFVHSSSVRLIPISSPPGARNRFLLALFPTLLFALNPIWTYETTLAEVYSWHVAWALAAVFYYIPIARRLNSCDDGFANLSSTRDAMSWGLLCGLGVVHHVTAVLVALPLTISLAWIGRQTRKFSFRIISVYLLSVILPLGSYGFIAWRAFHPAVWQWPALAPSWSSVFNHIRASNYGHFIGYFDPSNIQKDLLSQYVYPFLFPGLILLILVALFVQERSEKTILFSLAITVIIGTAFSFDYGVSDPSSYFLAPLAISLCGIAPFGIALVQRWKKLKRIVLVATVPISIILLFLLINWIQTSSQRKQLFVEFDSFIHSMWASIPFERAIVLWPSDMSTRLVEYQLLRGEKPEVIVVNPLLLNQEFPRLKFKLQHGFDPIAGISVSPPISTNQGEVDSYTQEYANQVSHRISKLTSLPVIVFDPVHKSVRLLRKDIQGTVPDSSGSDRKEK